GHPQGRIAIDLKRTDEPMDGLGSGVDAVHGSQAGGEEGIVGTREDLRSIGREPREAKPTGQSGEDAWHRGAVLAGDGRIGRASSFGDSPDDGHAKGSVAASVSDSWSGCIAADLPLFVP